MIRGKGTKEQSKMPRVSLLAYTHAHSDARTSDAKGVDFGWRPRPPVAGGRDSLYAPDAVRTANDGRWFCARRPSVATAIPDFPGPRDGDEGIPGDCLETIP